jgi:hypothetical protein
MASSIGLAIAFVSAIAMVVAYGSLSALPAGPHQLLMFTATGLVFALTGTFVVWRTRNLVGWVLLGIGIFLDLIWIGFALNAADFGGSSPGRIEMVLTFWFGFAWVPALFLLAVFLPLLFPTGHPPSRRWRMVAWVGAIGVVGGLIGTTVETLTQPTEAVLRQDFNTWLLVNTSLVIGVLGSSASVVSRLRHAGVVERQQIKWVALALSLLGSLVLLSLTPIGALVLGDNPLMQNIFLLSFSLIPLSILVAISRYRLYEIDRIISRTLSYAIIVVLLLLVYGALVVGLTSALPSASSDLAVAGSTLAVAALFNPLRRRVQTVVDRRFNRTAVDRAREVEEFSKNVRDMTDSEAICRSALDLVDRTFQPTGSTHWIRG